MVRRPGVVTRARLAKLVQCLDAWGAGDQLPAETLVLLSLAWPFLAGGRETAMAGIKLLTRLPTRPVWKPPVLAFDIERHPRRAQHQGCVVIQHWRVELDTDRVSVSEEMVRQPSTWKPDLKKRSTVVQALVVHAPHRLHPMLARILEAIRQGADAPGLTWTRLPGSVSVAVCAGLVISAQDAGSRKKQKQLHRTLREALQRAGWIPHPQDNWLFRRPSDAGSHQSKQVAGPPAPPHAGTTKTVPVA
jgi:hypothetical protein